MRKVDQRRRTIVMNRIIHFEIHAGNPERAVQFYRDVFGWEIREWVMPGARMKEENRYWLVTTGPANEPGINGGIVFRRGPAPVDGQGANAFVCTIGVANLNDSVARVMKSGGSVLLPRMPVTGIGWWASCRDTEGNSFGMMQEDTIAR
jgi:predicted enzyme related to lactoylglutathione lyase